MGPPTVVHNPEQALPQIIPPPSPSDMRPMTAPTTCARRNPVVLAPLNPSDRPRTSAGHPESLSGTSNLPNPLDMHADVLAPVDERAHQPVPSPVDSPRTAEVHPPAALAPQKSEEPTLAGKHFFSHEIRDSPGVSGGNKSANGYANKSKSDPIRFFVLSRVTAIVMVFLSISGNFHWLTGDCPSKNTTEHQHHRRALHSPEQVHQSHRLLSASSATTLSRTFSIYYRFKVFFI